MGLSDGVRVLSSNVVVFVPGSLGQPTNRAGELRGTSLCLGRATST